MVLGMLVVCVGQYQQVFLAFKYTSPQLAQVVEVQFEKVQNYGIIQQINYLNSQKENLISQIKTPHIVNKIEEQEVVQEVYEIDETAQTSSGVGLVQNELNEIDANNLENEDSKVNTLKEVNPNILIIGDSMISGGFGVELEKELIKNPNTVVHRFGKPSTGLVRSDYFDWNKKFVELYDQYKPNIVIIMFGANDGQSFVSNGEFIKLGTKEWEDEYRKRMDEFIQKLYVRNISAYWIGNPIAKTEYFSNKMATINKIEKDRADAYEYIDYISTWDLLLNEKGEYSDYLKNDKGEMVLVRTQDGIHVTMEGAEMLASEVVEQIKLEPLIPQITDKE